jgi:two-component system, sporulation sensor kinase B
MIVNLFLGISGYKDLFLDILFIIISIFLYQLFWLGKGTDPQKNRFGLAVLMGFSIIMCMIIPLSIVKGSQVDVRTLPLMICFLYGGNRSGLFLLIFLLSYRFYIGGTGFYFSLLIYVLFVPLLMVLVRPYSKWSKMRKIFASMLLISYHTLVIAVVNYFSYQPFQPKLWIIYTIIYAFATWLSIMIFESIIENMSLKDEINRTEKLQVLSQLAASIAHEVRNPLTIVRGFLQLIDTRGASPEDIKSYIQLSIGELDRAQTIISDYLSFAKPEMDKRERINVKDQLIHVNNIMSAYALSERIELDTEAADGLWIIADPQKFIQAIINLVKNSIEAMPLGGKIIIRAAQGEEFIFIHIIDEGTGMTKEQIQSLGNPFYSLKEKGTGLGLMVTYRIIQSIGGKIKVDSIKGKGTQFTLQIPNA